MKKLKEDVGIPLYPKPNSFPAPSPAPDAKKNNSKSEIENLKDKNAASS